MASLISNIALAVGSAAFLVPAMAQQSEKISYFWLIMALLFTILSWACLGLYTKEED